MARIRNWLHLQLRAAHVVKRRRQIVEWLDEVDTYDPCDNPDCQHARQKMRDIVG